MTADVAAAAAHGEFTDHGTPHGSTSITPFLCLPDVRAALSFYEHAFDAEVLDVTEVGGSVVHAVLDFGNGQLQLGEPSPAYRLIEAPGGEDDYYSLSLYCADVDATVTRAELAGATIRMPVTTFVSGDRYGSIRDPFGVRWSVMTRVEDLSPAESARRVAAWAASQVSD
ncbi:VOC family protein [Nocardioides limicola]|uniref:VOC family protein n=1 Tax=Nocardioides limicola TaxID=2803368 RepID=UPI00193C536E|nr:VOC family protein [Nocardioides sp. DJM-14]